MAQNRKVADLWCFEVLARLSDYLDGELRAEDKSQVDAHLAQCDECTRFGGEFGSAIAALRTSVQAEEPLPEDVARRLEQALRNS